MVLNSCKFLTPPVSYAALDQCEVLNYLDTTIHAPLQRGLKRFIWPAQPVPAAAYLYAQCQVQSVKFPFQPDDVLC